MSTDMSCGEILSVYAGKISGSGLRIMSVFSSVPLTAPMIRYLAESAIAATVFFIDNRIRDLHKENTI